MLQVAHEPGSTSYADERQNSTNLFESAASASTPGDEVGQAVEDSIPDEAEQEAEPELEPEPERKPGISQTLK